MQKNRNHAPPKEGSHRWLQCGIILLAFLFLSGVVVAQEHSTAALPAVSPSPPAPDAPSPVVDNDAFADALKPFHKIANAAELGVSFVDYKRLLLDAKTDLDEPLSKLPKGEQRTEIEEAMNDFRIAADVWAMGIRGVTRQAVSYNPVLGSTSHPVYYPGIESKTDFYRELRKRYGENLLPPPKAANGYGRGIVAYEPILKIVWRSAANHLDHAMKLQREK